MSISTFCFYFGIVSIPLSIGFWFLAPELGGISFEAIADEALRAALKDAHSQRWGIFVGLWPATLLVLSEILNKKGL